MIDTNEIQNSFPKRPLIVSPKGAGFFRNAGLFLLTNVVAVGILSWQVFLILPDLVLDWKISHDFIKVERGTLNKGECETRKKLFVTCKLNVTSWDSGSGVSRESEIAFFDISLGDYSADVVKFRPNPKLIATDFAIEKLYSRIGFFLVFTIGSILSVLYAFIVLFRAGKPKRIGKKLSHKILKPILVKVKSIKNASNSTALNYSYDSFGKEKKDQIFFYKTGPLCIFDNNTSFALAVTDNEAGSVLPVDADLQWLDMTDPEKEKLFSVLQKYSGVAEEKEE